MIRQAISCDICGTEKKQTNHWFVAYDQGGELRVSGWNSRNRLRSGSKHLCGQTCLHKLVDDFMAKCFAACARQSAANDGAIDAQDEIMDQAMGTDTSLTSVTALTEVASSARQISKSAPAAPARPPLRMPMELVSAPASLDEGAVVAADEPSRYVSRNWRAAAWERERERELRAVERHPAAEARRRFIS